MTNCLFGRDGRQGHTLLTRILEVLGCCGDCDWRCPRGRAISTNSSSPNGQLSGSCFGVMDASFPFRTAQFVDNSSGSNQNPEPRMNPMMIFGGVQQLERKAKELQEEAHQLCGQLYEASGIIKLLREENVWLKSKVVSLRQQAPQNSRPAIVTVKCGDQASDDVCFILPERHGELLRLYVARFGHLFGKPPSHLMFESVIGGVQSPMKVVADVADVSLDSVAYDMFAEWRKVTKHCGGLDINVRSFERKLDDLECNVAAKRMLAGDTTFYERIRGEIHNLQEKQILEMSDAIELVGAKRQVLERVAAMVGQGSPFSLFG